MSPHLDDITGRLLGWFQANQRRLPWREDYDPYGIWIAEIMLQQTQVQTAIPYYHRFLSRFPTVQALAEAPLEAVLQQWAGLGYYRRAQYLHEAAQRVVSDCGGEIPHSIEELMSLPGIGRYTAGAIRSIGFNEDAPVVDGNVIRVLARLFGIEGDPKKAATQRRFWKLAEALIPPGQSREFNQALMEFGALVCTPLQPGCSTCVLRPYCAAYTSGDPTRFPERSKRPKTRCLRDVVGIVRRDDRYLLAQRRRDDRWGGLWEFPRGTCLDAEAGPQALTRILNASLGIQVQVQGHLHTLRHTITHHRVTLKAYLCRWISGTPRAVDYATVRWCPASELGQYPAPAPQKKLVRHLLDLDSAELQGELDLSP